MLAVGAIMVDMLCQVARLPRSGEDRGGGRAVVGGCAFNAANVLRQLGAPYELFAPVGCGIFARFVERELRERGLEAPRFDDRDSGGCMCFVEPGGERTMVTLPGIERHFVRAWFDRVEAARFGCGFASGYEVEGPGGDAIISFFEDHPSIELYYAPARASAAWARRRRRASHVASGMAPERPRRLRIPGAPRLKGGRRHRRECGNAVVITAGKDGAHLFVDGRHAVISAGLVDVVDTVGAGDAHLGALTAARAAGRSWEDALALANRVAGAVCGVEGSTLADEAFARTGARL
ncbi:MAG: carbohydrate kinase family protein [Eggerthellaceae bacterium]